MKGNPKQRDLGSECFWGSSTKPSFDSYTAHTCFPQENLTSSKELNKARISSAVDKYSVLKPQTNFS